MASTYSRKVSQRNILQPREHHAFSLDMLLPLLAVSLSILQHNWYPYRVFVGDTFCYFAGIGLSMESILGYFSVTLRLLLIPQVEKSLYSLQLVRLVNSPSHRMPMFNRQNW